jgi:hypothetical protein
MEKESNIKADGAQSNHCASKGELITRSCVNRILNYNRNSVPLKSPNMEVTYVVLDFQFLSW